MPTNKLYSRYLPVLGASSYCLFSTNVMCPAAFNSMFGSADMAVANALWFNSHIGIGCYLFTSKHLQNTCVWRKVGLSVFGSVMFNFGSVLLMATLKKLMPDEDILKLMTGVALSGSLLCVGREYARKADKGGA